MDRRKEYKEKYGDVPEKFIDESIKIDRHTNYSLYKDALGRAIYYGNENELYKHRIADYKISNELTNDNDIFYPYLEKALGKLKVLRPKEYDTLYSYYLSENPKNISEIAVERGVSKQAVSKMLAKARKHLKILVIKYKNQT